VDGISPGVGMVIGQARFELPPRAPLWQRLQALDFASLGIASAGLAAAGAPFSCSGASLAFTRHAFDQVSGWDGTGRLVSGDDEFLLSKIHRQGLKVAAAVGPDAVVLTRPVASLRELWHQRLRWASKGIYYRPFQRLMLAGVFLFCLALTVGPLALAFGARWWVWIGGGVFKAIMDWWALTVGAPLFGDRIRPAEFVLAEILHPASIVLFAVAGHCVSFVWKGQRFRSITGGRR